jgi:hypothetical protein
MKQPAWQITDQGRHASPPTGHLHLGHERTFWIAPFARGQTCGGRILPRNR